MRKTWHQPGDDIMRPYIAWIALGFVNLIAPLGTAVAADAPVPIEYAPPPPPLFYNWSGIYIGAHAGYAWDRTQGSVGTFTPDTTDQKFSGGLGGAQIGVNHQMGARCARPGIVGLLERC
jgi:outer membrane immunogenic protein